MNPIRFLDALAAENVDEQRSDHFNEARALLLEAVAEEEGWTLLRALVAEEEGWTLLRALQEYRNNKEFRRRIDIAPLNVTARGSEALH